ncbi:MAG: hypothetical protein IJ727_09740, partial [Treponema sp.]|nr:hypothetical protein [Treponema sp.]
DRLNVIFFDLIKIHKLLGKPADSLSKLEKGGLFLAYVGDERRREYIESLTESEEGLMNAKSSLCMVSEDEINWARQNTIFKAQRDYNTGMYNAEKRGFDRGVQQGMAQGMAQGLQQGMTQGARQNALANARNAITMGLSPEQTAQITSLPLEEVLALKKEITPQETAQA